MAADRNDRMLGESSRILEVQEQVSRIAPLRKPVLIVGERGTGKELVAARVHFLSERWGQPFLKLNCAAISDSLLDSELFGHEAGAFSGAVRQHKGYFERADGGTLFLDELATTSAQVQEKILRVIEYGELLRVGGDRLVEVDVRLVAATNGDLPAMAAAGKFRSDLLDRLAFDVITLPPLRERREDIMLLAEFFALGMVKEMEREYFPGFSPRAAAQLQAFDWPGNVRELKNVVERAVYRTADPDQPIDQIVFDPFESPFRLRESVESAPEPPQPASEATPETDTLQVFTAANVDFKTHIQAREVDLIRRAYAHCQFNQRKTAEFLGLTYDQLRGYLRKYEL
ncbi:phage shock protein operon transcriptional activator [Gilvimarinus sp. F26214L]|uniref:phage shock protein operon transcriptional activator n=1 Tax=Gilvimarinus sp. DZF01 TaxID=3461371 RepID=UPI004045C998